MKRAIQRVEVAGVGDPADRVVELGELVTRGDLSGNNVQSHGAMMAARPSNREPIRPEVSQPAITRSPGAIDPWNVRAWPFRLRGVAPGFHTSASTRLRSQSSRGLLELVGVRFIATAFCQT